MPDGLRNAVIGEAGCQPLGQSEPPVRTREQRNTAVRRDRAAVESAHKLAPAGPSQIKLGLNTRVSASGITSCSGQVVLIKPLSLSRSPVAPYGWEKFRLGDQVK